MKGHFITFEGVEGCGKSTQIVLLQRYLEEAGYDAIATREPGGTPIAEAIREVLLHPGNEAMSPAAELLLYEAARAQLVHEVIRPALSRGAVVLCDRFADSTTAYQGAGRGLPMEEVLQLHRVATGGVWPELTFLIDLSPEEGLARARKRGRQDRIEQESIAFHERVREGFLQLAEQAPQRITIIDGAQSVEAVHAAVRARVDLLLQRPDTGTSSSADTL
jgi:dTMP kinase